VSTMTLNLDDRYMAALEALADQHAMTKTQVIRQALRLYQAVCARTANGEELAFTKNGVVVPVIVVGLPALD